LGLSKTRVFDFTGKISKLTGLHVATGCGGEEEKRERGGRVSIT